MRRLALVPGLAMLATVTNGTDGRDVCYVSPDDATRSCERVIENVRAGTSAVPQDAPVKAFSS